MYRVNVSTPACTCSELSQSGYHRLLSSVKLSSTLNYAGNITNQNLPSFYFILLKLNKVLFLLSVNILLKDQIICIKVSQTWV